MQVKTEESVFEAVKLWINDDFETKCEYIYELLKQVRLVYVERDYLTNEVSAYPARNFSQECQQLIQNALEHQLSAGERDEPTFGQTVERGYPEGKILLFAGNKIEEKVDEEGTIVLQVVNRFDCLVDDGYEEIANFNIARKFFGTTIVKGKFFITNGSNKDCKRILKNVEVYSCEDNETLSIVPLNTERSHHGCCSRVRLPKCYPCVRLQW